MRGNFSHGQEMKAENLNEKDLRVLGCEKVSCGKFDPLECQLYGKSTDTLEKHEFRKVGLEFCFYVSRLVKRLFMPNILEKEGGTQECSRSKT